MTNWLEDAEAHNRSPQARAEIPEGTWLMHVAKCLAWLLALVLPPLVWSRWGPSIAPGTPEADLLPWIRGLAIYYTACWLCSAWIVGRAGWLTLRSGRYPYPGQWSLLSVSRNPWWVRFNGYAFLVVAAALLYVLALVWTELEIAAILGLIEFAPTSQNNCLE